MNPSIEQARQNVKGMLSLEEYAKKHCPKGKRYKGLKFEPFQEKIKGGWMTMGYRAVPVYEKITSANPETN